MASRVQDDVSVAQLHAEAARDDQEQLVLVLLRMPGGYLIVPHGVEHCPVAEPTCEVVLFGRQTMLNTGNVDNERTVRHLQRIA